MKSKEPGGSRRELKIATVEQLRRGESVTRLAKQLQVSRALLYKWLGQADQGKLPPLLAKRPQPSAAEQRLGAAQQEIAELERLVGQLTAENRFFRGALQRVGAAECKSSGPGKRTSAPKSKR